MQKFLCTNCNYTYNPYIGDNVDEIEPGIDFFSLSDDWRCPVCGDDKDSFIEIPENINEIGSLSTMIPQEEKHIPFYYEKDNKIIVNIGTQDESFDEDEEHFIEYVGLYDEFGEEIEIRDFPGNKNEIIFDLDGLEDYQIRASCSLHGVWKGVKIS